MYKLYNVYIMYKIADFRSNIRKAFNEAEAGKSVYVERHGVVYELVKRPNYKQDEHGSMTIQIPPTNPHLKVEGYASKRDVEKIKSGESVELSKTPTKVKNIELATPTLKQVAERKGVKFCPNGHAIPEGRSRCMGKGCKYA